MKCDKCGKEFEPHELISNSSRTKFFCKECYNILYFLCPIDGRYKLRKYGRLDDSGVMVSSRYVKETFCFDCGTKIVSASPFIISIRSREYFVSEQRTVCKKCYSQNYRKTFNGLMVQKSDAIETEDGYVIHKEDEKAFTFDCGYCHKKVLYLRKLAAEIDGHKMFVCNKCINILSDKGFSRCKICNIYTNYSSKYSRVIAAVYGGKTCSECSKNSFPLYYESGMFLPEGKGRKIGIEIECNPSVKSQCDIALLEYSDRGFFASAKKDGSLRGSNPVEYVSPQFLYEDTYEEWVDKICDNLDAKIYNRCGLHIHIGCEDMSWYDVMMLCKWAKKNETRIFTFVSPSRRMNMNENTAGLPLILPNDLLLIGKSILTKHDFINVLYGAGPNGLFDGHACPIKQRRANDRQDNVFRGIIHRYWWLNVHGYFHKRAIEIRLHQGTTNPTKIKKWVALWLFIFNHFASGRRGNPLDMLPPDIKEYYDLRAKQLAGIKPETI